MNRPTLPPFERRGRAVDPVPFRWDDLAVRLKGCPDCDGRGWFLIRPFATGSTNGLGGLGNMTQCLTCLDAHAYFNTHGTLPRELLEVPSIAAAIAETTEIETKTQPSPQRD